MKSRAAILLVIVAALSITINPNFDTPWYLRTGADLLRARQFLRVDPYSFTSDHPWMNHEWLSQVLYALTYRVAGLWGLAVFQALLVTATLAVLLRAHPSAVELEGLLPVAFVITALLLRENATPRAQSFSEVLFAAILVLCFRDLQKESRALFWAVPIHLLWAQLHGGMLTGLAVIAMRFLARPSGRIILIGALSALATCLSPLGLAVWGLFFGKSEAFPAVREFRPLWFYLVNGVRIYWLFVVLVGAAAAAVAWRWRRGERVRFDALVLALFVAGAAKYARMMSEASIVAFAVLAPVAAELTSRAQKQARLGFLFAVAGLLLGVIGSGRTLGAGWDPNKFPLGAVDYLNKEHPPGPMFNPFNYGGYLLFAYPQEKVFIDSRGLTVYSVEHLKNFLALYDEPTRFNSLEERYHFRLAVLQRQGKGAQFLEWLAHQPGWTVRYADDLAAVLTRE
jgi:hypothetical protein